MKIAHWMLAATTIKLISHQAEDRRQVNAAQQIGEGNERHPSTVYQHGEN